MKNLEKIKLREKAYRINNPEKVKATEKKSAKKKTSKLRLALINRYRNTVAKEYRVFNYLDLLGCSLEDVIKHIEDQFQPGMAWKNHGINGFHIDHIKPCSSFNLTDPEQQKKCFHYTNLQPLWAVDNRRKKRVDSPKTGDILFLS